MRIDFLLDELLDGICKLPVLGAELHAHISEEKGI
jgi:hypothetical protein